MIKNEIAYPFYTKATIILVGIISFISVLYIAQDIIIPIVMALIIAILLYPVVGFFVRHKINRIFAIWLTLFITFLIVAAFCFLIYSQANRFFNSWPTILNKFSTLISQSISWSSNYLAIDKSQIQDWVAKTKTGIVSTNSPTLSQAIINLGSGILTLFLIPTYVFIILYYQPLLLEFTHRVFNNKNQSPISEVITQVKKLIQSYLIGLIIEIIIVSIMNSAVLMILGIEYAIFIGIIGGLFNLIPYIGGIAGVAIPVIVALVVKSSVWPAIWIVIAYTVIQLIDNNYIVPVMVASKVKINALFSIIIVIAGNALWGATGMFLSIPILAITKLIFDHIESLKPWGFLLGDTMSSTHKTDSANTF